MIDEAALAKLMHRSIEDKTAEPAFLKALLDAMVYVHTPRYDGHDRLRLIQFTLPSGQCVLPFFSEKAQAVAAIGDARIVAMPGRQLFELTRGATLMLNPNGISCTLYPEEIAALLERGEVAIVEHEEIPDQSLQVGSLIRPPPTWFIEVLISLYTALPCVEAAYLAETRWPAIPGKSGFLIALAVNPADAERAARATITTIQPQCAAYGMCTVDLTTFEPDAAPEWLIELGIEPFYCPRPNQQRVGGTESLN